MYKGLIDHLVWVYGYVCKGRGKLSGDDMTAIAKSSRILTENAPEVIGNHEVEGAEDRADLAEARKINTDIEEMSVFLMSLEIV